jgi:predicted PurR-regulated permease PerM
MDAVLFATLLWQVVDFLRELTNLKTQKSAVLTQLTAWVGGIILVILASHAKVSADLILPGMSTALGHLDGSSQVLYGLMVASLGSSLVDVKQSIDNTDSSTKPPLLPPSQQGV